METMEIIYCEDCTHRFKSRQSRTGYACEVWGHGDFACDVPLDGYCHKAKMTESKYIQRRIRLSENKYE